jgi:predicted protein tyrosine phosphatase
MTAIYVSPLSAVKQTVANARASHLVTLINGETNVATPDGIGEGRHLRLAMNDICDAQHGLVSPCADHVDDLIAFVRSWDRQAPMLIHCWAGISRSTAAAFIALCAMDEAGDELRIAKALRGASPTAWPNRLLVTLGDAALGRNGRMVKAVESIGRGRVAVEGDVFSLPLHRAS